MAPTPRQPFALPSEFYSVPLDDRIVVDDAQRCTSFPPLQRLRVDGELFELRTSSGKNTEKKSELLAKLAAGELVELEIDVRAFQQEKGVRNANNLRFKDSILRRLAKSFKGQPFLRDHMQDDVSARGGTILDSRPVAIDNGVAFDMTILVAAPWAVEGILRGTIDRFSIGWAHGGRETILCSCCGTPVFAECYHLPGDTVETKSGDTEVVEFVFTEAAGVETSGVSVPAVQGTGISEVRSALSQCAATAARKKENIMLKKIAKVLGLSEDASEETVLAALAARNAAQESTAEAHAALATANTELAARVEELSRSQREAEVGALFTQFADRLPVARDAEGKRTQSPLEVQLRKLAASDIAAARAILEAQPKVAPTGPAETLVTVAGRSGDDLAPPPVAAPWNPQLASMLKQLGVTQEEYFHKFGPHCERPSLLPDPARYGFAAATIH